MKIRITAILGIGAFAAGLGGCGGTEVDAAPVSDPTGSSGALIGAEAVRIGGIRVAPVIVQAWQATWSGPARIAVDPDFTHPLGAMVEGRVARVLVQPGDPVRAGQVLATLHSHDLLDALSARAAAEASLARAENEVGLARSAAARAERLHAGGAASLAELERASAALFDAETVHHAAAAEAARGREMVAHLVGAGPVPAGVEPHEVLIRSPIDAVVVSRSAEPGQVAVIGAPLLIVSRLDRLHVVLQVPEREAAGIAAGAQVRFTSQAQPDREWTAEVVRVAPAIDVTTRTLEVRARVLDGDATLRPEMFATARLEGAPGGAALTVPAAAIQLLEGDTVLIAAQQRGAGFQLDAVPVRVGRRTAERAEILSGVAEGTDVVVEGASIARAEIIRRREQEGS